jgi:DNA-binding NarL/FixJ family response regulator
LPKQRLATRPLHVDPRALAGAQTRLPPSNVIVVEGADLELVRMVMQRARAQAHQGQLLVLAEDFSREVAYALLELGAKGLIRYAERPELPRAIEAVGTGSYWVPRAVLGDFVDSMLQDRKRWLSLTVTPVSRREQEILDCLLNNLSNKEIADRCSISERTVKFHVSNLLSKYGVQRRADLILMCYQKQRTASASASI